MKIIIAPNSFKGSLDAFQVAQSIQNGLLKSDLDADCHLFPIADGGDHTLEVFQNWFGGSINRSEVVGPLGAKVGAEWALIEDGKTAVIEMAKATGISLVKKSMLNPLKASSYGTGQLIKSAIESGAKKIILGLGGSATVDGGLGILQALGAKLLDSNGNLIGVNTNPVMEIEHISLNNIDPRTSEVEFLILCDVENPLLGKDGAAHVFGPQKGADPKSVEKLEKSMKRFNTIIKKISGKDFSQTEGAGAAGGIAVSLKAFFNTTMVSGVDFLLEKMKFEDAIEDADLLITAEGKVDAQTLQGKGPFGVASKAKNHGIPTLILAGKADDIDQLNHGFDAVFPITNGPMSLEKAMRSTAKDLEETARQIGNLLALKKIKGCSVQCSKFPVKHFSIKP